MDEEKFNMVVGLKSMAGWIWGWKQAPLEKKLRIGANQSVTKVLTLVV